MPAVHRAPSLLLAMLSALVAPCALAGIGEGTAKGGGAADTIPADIAPAHVVADDQAQAAVAAVLVATLVERFADPMLEVRLDPAKAEAGGPRDHVLHGTGQLRLDGGGDQDWLAFRYSSRYDALFGTAGYPEIALGADGAGEGERFVPNDAALVGELETRLAAEFEARPGAGRVFLQFDDISSVQAGDRFLRIEASGIADFGPGGSTAARVDALYDLKARRWLGIEHALAPNIVAHGDGGTAGY